MNEVLRFLFVLGFFMVPCSIFAADYEDGGVVESVDLARNSVVIDGVVYHLANTVKESSMPSGPPAIMILKKGMYVFFYGKDASAKMIDSISVHSNGVEPSLGDGRGADEY